MSLNPPPARPACTTSTKGAGISNSYDFHAAWLKLWGVK